MARDESRFSIHAGLEDKIGYLLMSCGRIIQEYTNKELEPLEMSPRFYRVLLILKIDGPLSQQLICEKVDVDKNTMVQIINQLEDLGYVKRSPSEEDRRAYQISLTAKASSALKSGEKMVYQAQEKFLECLSDREAEALQAALSRLLIYHKTAKMNEDLK